MKKIVRMNGQEFANLISESVRRILKEDELSGIPMNDSGIMGDEFGVEPGVQEPVAAEGDPLAAGSPQGIQDIPDLDLSKEAFDADTNGLGMSDETIDNIIAESIRKVLSKTR